MNKASFRDTENGEQKSSCNSHTRLIHLFIYFLKYFLAPFAKATFPRKRYERNEKVNVRPVDLYIHERILPVMTILQYIYLPARLSNFKQSRSVVKKASLQALYQLSFHRLWKAIGNRSAANLLRKQ